MLVFGIYLILCTLFLAGKDASSYKLKDPNPTDIPKTLKTIKRWHLQGVILNALFAAPFIFFDQPHWWQYLIYTLLVRLSLFDLFFNSMAGLPIKYLGGTAADDKLFKFIFGEQGAVKKSIVFGILVIIATLLLK